jgi:RHS repeat-associated protein
VFRSATPRFLTSRRRQVSIFTVAALAMSSLTAVAAVSSTTSQAAATPAPITSADDKVSAMLAAQRQHSRVEVLSERTPTTQVFANADGSYTSEIAAGPVRLFRGGQWVDVDATLQHSPDGTVTTVATPTDLSFSAGGDGALATATTTGDEGPGVAKGTSFGIDWPGTLPAPTLHGRTATYADVAPGMDVTVTAKADGFTDNVILKSRPTSPVTVRLPLRVGKMSVAATHGVLRLTDSKGRLHAVAPGPRMWDAAKDAVTGEPSRSAPIAMSVANVGGRQELDLTPDFAWLSDPATQYPVVLDPTTTLYTQSDTWVENDIATNQNGANDLRAGHSSTSTARSLVKFNISSLSGTQILGADLMMMQIHASTCQSETIGIHKVTSSWTPTSITWSSGQPTVASTPLLTNGSNGFGYSASCPAAYVHWQDTNSSSTGLTNLVQQWVDGSVTNNGLELKAEDETNAFTFKKWNSADYGGVQTPRINITYNHYPAVSRPHAAPLVTVGTTNWVNSLTPDVFTQVSDVDSSTVHADFDIIWGATTVVNNLQGGTVSGGQYSHATIPSGIFSDGQTYVQHSWADDGNTRGTASANLVYTIDVSAPAAPSISSTQYSSGLWHTAGGSGTFTFSSTDGGSGVDHYLYSLDEPTPANVASGSSVTINPMPDGWHTLYVAAVDKVGNVSTVSTYSFGATPAVTSPADGAITQHSVYLTARTQPAGTGVGVVTYYYRRSAQDQWQPIPTADVALTSSGPTYSGWPYTYAASGDTGIPPSLTWNVAGTLSNTDGPALVAVCFGSSCPTTSTSTLPSGSSTGTPAVTLDTQGFDVAATRDITPGSVNLLTGNFQITANDASVPGNQGADLSVGRTFNTVQATSVLTNGIFGPGWSASLPGEGAGTDYASLTDTGSTLVATHSDQSTVSFATTGTAGTYAPTGPDADSGLSVVSTTSGCAVNYKCYKLDDLEGSVLFQSTVTNPTTASLSNQVAYTVISITEPGSTNITKFTYASGLVTRIISPAPSGATCTDPSSASTWTPGCRGLDLAYTSGRLTAVTYDTSDATNPLKVDVACYDYDGNGRLADEWDPRDIAAAGTGSHPIACGTAVRPTHYTYDTSGRIATVTQAWKSTGAPLAGWTMAYDSNGRLSTVTRAHLSGYTAGSEVTTVVYSAPVAADGSNPSYRPDLTSTTTATWAQTDNPDPTLGATAICPPGASVPGTNTGNLSDCTLMYLDANGRSVNTAAYSGAGGAGWHVNTTEYDALGHLVRNLDANNQEEALSPTSGAGALLGLPTDTRQAALDLSTINIYTPNPTDQQPDLTSTYGPYHQVELADGTLVNARQLTQTTYDQGTDGNGHATGVSYHLVVDVKTSASQSPDASPVNAADIRDTETHYYTSTDTINGWTYHTPLQTIVDPAGLAITSTTVLDPNTGRVTAIRMPSALSDTTNATAGSTKTIYYAAGATSGDSACDNQPRWDGLVCKKLPGASVPTSGMPSLITSQVISYDYIGRPLEIDETSTTDTTHVRVTKTVYGFNSTITSGVSANPYATTSEQTAATVTGGYEAATPAETVTFSADTGLPTSISNGTIADSTSYDDFGRPISYTENTSATGAQANTATAAYDPTHGWVTQTADAHTTIAYTHNSTNEHRGLITSQAVTVNGTTSYSGTFSASYDSNGNILSQTDPKSVSTTFIRDESGQLTSRVDTQGGSSWLSDSVIPSIHGQWSQHLGVAGAQQYAYDADGRLTQAEDTPTSGTCATRTYQFSGSSGLDSNRTSSTSFPAASDGSCQATTGSTTVSHTYDAGDRLLSAGSDSGIVYDTFGRITTMPAADVTGGANLTADYYTNDLVHSATQGTKTYTWNLDATGRLGEWTATGSIDKTNHYDAGSGDSPSWIAESADASQWTANVADLVGNLAVIVDQTGTATYQYANLHGDIAGTATAGAGAPTPGLDYGEFGTTPGTGSRYGWLGAEQRSTDGIAGLALMGVRLYDPMLGRFLQTDPVAGGSANAYDYSAQDAVNLQDPSGLSYDAPGCNCHWVLVRKFVRVWHYIGGGAIFGQARIVTYGWWGPVKLVFICTDAGGNCEYNVTNSFGKTKAGGALFNHSWTDVDNNPSFGSSATFTVTVATLRAASGSGISVGPGYSAVRIYKGVDTPYYVWKWVC